MRTAVIYARVSSKEQEKEGYSIAAQLKLLEDYAQREDLRIIEKYIDVETAKQSGRTNFNRMVEFLQQEYKQKSAEERCRILLVEKTDRLFRNIPDWATLDVDELELDLDLVKENVVITKDSRSSEKFVFGIKVLMAKNFIDNLSEETRKGMAQKAAEGIWPTGAPVGYVNVPREDGKKVIVPDDESAPVIKELFRMGAAGEYSVVELTSIAKSKGLVYRKSRRPLTKSDVHKMLRHRIYMGEIEWRGKIYPGIHTPLVSKELWEQVQTVLTKRFGSRHRKVKHDFAYARLISCGHCGCSLVGDIKKSKYVYYRCSGHKARKAGEVRCPEPYAREEAIEEEFLQLLGRLKFDQEVLDLVSESLRLSHGQMKQEHEEAITRLQAQYQVFQQRIERMYEDKLDGKIDTAFFERRQAEWRDEQQRLKEAIDDHENANQEYLEDGVTLLELADNAQELFKSLLPNEKRRLLKLVVSNYTWKDGRLSAEFRQPFDLIATSNLDYAERKAVVGPEQAQNEIWLPGTDSNRRQGG